MSSDDDTGALPRAGAKMRHGVAVRPQRQVAKAPSLPRQPMPAFVQPDYAEYRCFRQQPIRHVAAAACGAFIWCCRSSFPAAAVREQAKPTARCSRCVTRYRRARYAVISHARREATAAAECLPWRQAISFQSMLSLTPLIVLHYASRQRSTRRVAAAAILASSTVPRLFACQRYAFQHAAALSMSSIQHPDADAACVCDEPEHAARGRRVEAASHGRIYAVRPPFHL